MTEYDREREEALWEDSLSQGAYLSLACRQYAGAYGEEEPEKAWILTPLDTWEPNPCYTGPRAPHPEDFDADLDALPPPPPPVGIDWDEDDDIPF